MRVALALLLAAAGALGQERGPVEVRVVGPSGTPLPGIGIGHGLAEGEGDVVGTTDERGVLRLKDVSYDGSVFVSIQDPRLPGHVVATHEGFRPIHVQGAPVDGPEVTIRAHDGVWCAIDFVDAETGDVVRPVPWALAELGEPTEPAPRRRQIVFGGLLRTGELPEGYVLADARFLVARSLLAREVRAVVPLRRTVLLHLKVLTHDGKPATDACTADGAAAADEGGVVLVGPLPFFRDDPVSAAVELVVGEDLLTATWAGRLPAEHRARIDAEVKLPPPDMAEEIDDGFEMPKDNTAIGVAPAPPPPAAERGSLEINALRFNGEPAAWATVDLRQEKRRSFGRLDADGFVRLDDLAAGAWTVTVHGPGLIEVAAEARVRPGAVDTVVLTEPTPGALSVHVLDESGRPVPFARLEPSRPDGFPVGSYEIADGVQRIDRFTDRDGTRKLAHLPPGPLVIRARYGARSGKRECTIEPAKTAEVAIRLGSE